MPGAGQFINMSAPVTLLIVALSPSGRLMPRLQGGVAAPAGEEAQKSAHKSRGASPNPASSGTPEKQTVASCL